MILLSLFFACVLVIRKRSTAGYVFVFGWISDEEIKPNINVVYKTIAPFQKSDVDVLV